MADTKDTNNVELSEEIKEETVADENAEFAEDAAKETGPKANWYVVHTYSGYENKVKANIEKTIENRHLEDEILEGELTFKGRIFMITMLCIGLKVYFSKDVKYTVKKLKEFKGDSPETTEENHTEA